MFSSLRLPRGRSQSSTSCAGGGDEEQGVNGDVDRHVYQVTPQGLQGLSSCPTSPLLSSKPPKTPRSAARRASKWGLDKALCPSIGSLRDRPRWDEDLLDDVLSSSSGDVCSCSKVTRVAVARGDGCLGITIRAGAAPPQDPLGARPLVITSVHPGGPADREGSIRPGDRLLAVDGTNLQLADLSTAHSALRGHSQSGVAVLTIEYSVCVVGAVVGAAGPLLVELARPPAHQLGITLVTVPALGQGLRTAVLVDDIKPASVADRSGAVHRGDQILAVDDVRVDGTDMTAGDVAVLLGGAGRSPGLLRLEILPAHCHNTWALEAGHAMSQPLLDPLQLQMHPGRSPCPSESGLSTFNSILSRRRLIRAFDNGSVASSTGSRSHAGSAGVVSHTETLSVLLRPGPCGYGLTVRASGPARKPVISAIQPDGPADRSGCLQVGDRIIAVDDREMDAEQLKLLLDNPGPPINLRISFSVAESVVPSSGVFTVKLAKCRSGLGITITGSKNGEFLLISDIKCGSVAHRAGTLSVGDRLLAIDGMPLAGSGSGSGAGSVSRTLDDAARILHASGDVVTLKVLKEDAPSEAGSRSSSWGSGWVSGSGWPSSRSAPRAVEYTVELVRHGGPLGLTIAGSEDTADAVTISGLTPGGLAERTGALHVGDRLLAINGESLRGRRLSEAVALFQNSPDVVTLKIARSTSATDSAGKMEGLSAPGAAGTGGGGGAARLASLGIPSVDSAVESWDSSPSQQWNASPTGTPLVLPLPLPDGENAKRRASKAVDIPGKSQGVGMGRVRAGSCPSLDYHLQADTHQEWDGSLEDLDSAATTAASLSLRTPNGSASDEIPPAPISPPACFRQQDCSGSGPVPLWPRPPPSPSGRISAARALNNDWQQRQKQQQQLQQQQSQPQQQQQLPQSNQKTIDSVDNYSSSPKLSSFQWLNNNNSTLSRTRRANDGPVNSSPGRHYDDFAELNNNLNLSRGRSGSARGMSYFVYDEQRASSLLSEEVAEDVMQELGLQPPMELYQVTIYKDSVYEDFGFSVSDGLYERGVFINRIRKAGPADATGVLRPYDRILQVNETRTHDLDCCLTVPLIAAAGDRIQLIVARQSCSEQVPGDLPHWLEDEAVTGTFRTEADVDSTVTQTI